jgi:hypothetical protein
MTGYVRQDVGNNIENGEIADATYLDQEFDAIQAGFNSSTGHNHDGTTGEGAPITQLGPGQDFIASSSLLRPKADATYDLGTGSFRFKDIYVSGNVTSLTGLSGTFLFTSGGSAAAPPLSFVGDTDTGIFASAANQMNLVTQGFTRVTIAPSGNVAFAKGVTITETLGVTGAITGASFDGDLSATDLTSGTVASARIAGSYTGITAVGALGSGSITSGFGNINIGGNTITSGAITSSGAVTSSQSFVSSTGTTILTTTGSGNILLRPSGIASTTGQLTIAANGNTTVAGTLTVAGTISGDLSATNLTGTIASARLVGAYTGITQVGTLTTLSVDNLDLNGNTISNGLDTAVVTLQGGTASGAIVRVFGPSHPTNASQIVTDASRYTLRNSAGSAIWFDLENTGITLASNMSITFAGTGAATTRSNLGLGTMALEAQGTAGGEFRTNTANDARFMISSNNLSQLTNLTTARSNLGLGSISTLDAGTGGSNFRNNTQNDARFHISGTNTLAAGDLPTDTAAVTWTRERIASMVVNSIGTYAFLKNNSGGDVAANGTASGTDLAYSNTLGTGSTSPSGTWRAMGNALNGSSTLFLRIS